jgi:hypothetical protein
MSLRLIHQLSFERVRSQISRMGWVPFLGAFVISIVALITYYPALNIGFWFDDFNLLEMAGRPTWSEFLVSSFDPRVQQIWYRPIRQVQWRIEYMLWGGDAFWYHVSQNLLHLFNCVLLFALVWRLSRNWRAGLIGALIYSVLPAYSISVFWLGTPDALASFFYLLAIWFWVDYLQNGSSLKLALTFLSFVIGLLTKEIDLTLPLTLLLVDRWLVAKPTPWKNWAARNVLFFSFLPVWAILEWNVLSGKLAIESSRADWLSVISNLGYYFSALSFPWAIDSAVRYLTLSVLVGLFIYAFITRKFRLLFLGVVGALSVIPMASSLGTSSRYLYLPLLVSAAGIGIIVESLHAWVQNHFSNRILAFLMSGVLVLIVAFATVSESYETAQAAEGFSTLARQTRLQFRPIFQNHASLEPDTFLYFIEPPFSSYNISGLMFLRYGASVTVEGNDIQGRAGLRTHKATYVIYPDEQSVLKEQRVDQSAVANVDPSLPVQFGSGISLDGFEVVNTQARPGEAIILILYWRALHKVDKDYTVFAHLLDNKGAIIEGYDSQPRRGTWPTTGWQPGYLVTDAIIFPITSDLPAGHGYRIEAGLYYLPTLERLSIADSGNDGKNAVVFSSFSVEP